MRPDTATAEWSRSAEFSNCGSHRLRLVRERTAGEGSCCFIMLNPSAADGERDDPTLRRCMGFAAEWGYRRLEVVNLFSLCTSDPAELSSSSRPLAPANDRYLLQSAQRCGLLVCAWGNRGGLNGRAGEVSRLLRERGMKLHHLGLTVEDRPRHPLYLPADTEPQPWNGTG